ncbi:MULTISPECIES: plasmid mobilization protein [Pseudomonas]|nr:MULTISPECIES: plasmid mobilization relaxosome protein MobC [Pseudomonas]EKV6969964.1 plasmid mobilization relaxosome protein MobC [Pseudomonas aeruginosa]EKW2847603.1 plasmid mobilization relaxosome protein MobC [Pseudomonas aeruginosa]MBH4413023.1 plasmid mobilization relaxosome protein MobC [Pseudomonas aeruginosa]MBN0210709.1 plasmid mobilization relaxosome protein MobC [Pseudomonas aeruginosa]MBN0610552.1 plasmid mobilization relaxosome protein MobC [Pseudomonas aeruginosa]
MSKKKRNGEQFNVRVSKEAKDKIVANAALLGISQAKYIEHLAVNGCNVIEIRNERFIEYVGKAEADLNKMGNNLNQMARAINLGKVDLVEKNIELFNNAKKTFDQLYSKLVEHEEKITLK